MAGHMIGAVPFLVKNGENGFVYEEGKPEQLFALTETLVRDKDLCRRMGRSAYETIVGAWNAEYAAESLIKLMERILERSGEDVNLCRAEDDLGLLPCAPAPVLWEQSARRQTRREWKERNRK